MPLIICVVCIAGINRLFRRATRGDEDTYAMNEHDNNGKMVLTSCSALPSTTIHPPVLMRCRTRSTLFRISNELFQPRDSSCQQSNIDLLPVYRCSKRTLRRSNFYGTRRILFRSMSHRLLEIVSDRLHFLYSWLIVTRTARCLLLHRISRHRLNYVNLI